jgi:peptide/nickel transport system ATP-binding protein
LASTVSAPSNNPVQDGSTAADAPLLSVDGLTTVFALTDGRTAAAVNDVSFSVRRGETLGLVGESGSGKSVTALSIIRLVQPPGRITAGRVMFEGQDLLSIPETAMECVRGRRIGFVFQEPMIALDPVYTIGFQIRETLEVHGLARGAAAKRRAVELLDAVRVPDPAKRAAEYPHQLSGGLRQRAMIALAIAAEPALVIADEPTTALDVTVQAEILDLLRDMRRQFSLSLLLITHDLGVVAEMADNVAVMYGGRIVERAPVSVLLETPNHPYTRGLLACLPDRAGSGRLVDIPGTVPPLGQLPAGCPFAPRCAECEAACEAAVPPLIGVTPSHGSRCIHAQPGVER